MGIGADDRNIVLDETKLGPTLLQNGTPKLSSSRVGSQRAAGVFNAWSRSDLDPLPQRDHARVESFDSKTYRFRRGLFAVCE
jgi:hypothetical protein